MKPLHTAGAPTPSHRSRTLACLIGLAASIGFIAMVVPGEAGAQAAAPRSLKDVPVQEAANLHVFLKGTRGQADGNAARAAAIRLGKVLFWDMQVGSDNVQACASCHFNAGADNRIKNQLDPGSNDNGDSVFGNSKIPLVPGPNDKPWNFSFAANADLMAKHFPLHRRKNPHAAGDGFNNPNVILDTNDIVSSQGVRLGDCLSGCLPEYRDTVFNWGDRNVRRSAPRNAPSAINAAFHVDMFWDGRGSFVFNGQTPFGFRDSSSKVKRWVNGTERLVTVRIPFASHASQAVGPPLSMREMSGHSRNFAQLAAKLLDPALVPLGRQLVSSSDSVLGPIARGALPGVNTTYETLIRAAFREDWTGPATMTGPASTMLTHNFPLYFGLALQLYQATLIADDTPFDRFMGANAAVREGNRAIAPQPAALTAQEQRGLAIYQGAANCIACHALPETSNHVQRFAGLTLRRARTDSVLGPVNRPTDPVNEVYPAAVLELMPMADGGLGVYDVGFYNIGVRPTAEDIGRASKSPSGLPLSYAELALLKKDGRLPSAIRPYVPDGGFTVTGAFLGLPQLFAAAGNRVVTQGAFKSPMLRNQEYMGPYFRNGADATLRHVVEFYARGSNFPVTNIAHLAPGIGYIPELDASLGRQQQADVEALVAFISRGLTDPRVAFRRAPFDHPQIFLPVGEKPGSKLPETFIELPAVGAAGGATPIGRFLGLDPQSR